MRMVPQERGRTNRTLLATGLCCEYEVGIYTINYKRRQHSTDEIQRGGRLRR